MKITLISILLLNFIACTNSKFNDTSELTNGSKNTQIESTIQNSSLLLTKTKAEIAYYDSISKRYFVVIDSSIVFDKKIIKQVIRDLEENNETSLKASISFFSDYKWANYKDILFINTPIKYPIEEYSNWLNFYYQGEFDFQTREYHTFPISDSKLHKRKTFKIKK
jgi:hypothetical protein